MTDQVLREALRLAARELRECLHSAEKGRVHFAGDDFHEALAAVTAALGDPATPAELSGLRADEAAHEPQPIVVNQKVHLAGLVVGDYVFASRWSDCDPGDPWMVGCVVEITTSNDTVYPQVVRLAGHPRHWPHAMKITEEQGRSICVQFHAMESLPQDFEAIARVFGLARRIDSPEGVETTGSTAQPPEPGTRRGAPE